jgi:ureidoglycolate lyase
MELTAEPLSAEAFAPFGDVLVAPQAPGRAYFEQALGNLRGAAAHPSLSFINRAPIAGLPLQITKMERHEFSSQTFVPLEVSRWLVVVAPHSGNGMPDVERAQAFVASSAHGITFKPNTWHYSLTVVDKPARMAVFMWCDGTKGDEQFVDVPHFTVRIAG